MRLYNEPIQTQGNPLPTSFHWRGRLFRIDSVVDHWVLKGRWWGQEEQRTYYLVYAETPDTTGYFEVCSSTCSGWLLVRVYD